MDNTFLVKIVWFSLPEIPYEFVHIKLKLPNYRVLLIIVCSELHKSKIKVVLGLKMLIAINCKWEPNIRNHNFTLKNPCVDGQVQVVIDFRGFMWVFYEVKLKVCLGFDGSRKVMRNVEMTGTDFKAKRVLRIRWSDNGLGLGDFHTFISLKH